MWAGFFVLVLADQVDGAWSWVRDLPLLAELVLWLALFLAPGSGCLDELLGGLATPPARAGVRVWLVARLDPAAEAGTGRRELRATDRYCAVSPTSRSSRRCSCSRPSTGAGMRWGATEAEVAGAMPGDELVAEPSFNATRAITIDARRRPFGPGWCRSATGAGFYSYDLFDNAARPSAERILPEHQQPKIGDWMPMASKVNETTAFSIKAFEQNRWMLWAKPHSTWAWKLVPLEWANAPDRATQRPLRVARLAGRASDADPLRVRRLPDDAPAPAGRETPYRAPRRSRSRADTCADRLRRVGGCGRDLNSEICSAARPPGAALAAALVVSAVALILSGTPPGGLVVFALAPDLAVLYGIAPGLARGQLHPRGGPALQRTAPVLGPARVRCRCAGLRAPSHLSRRRRSPGRPRRVRPRDRSAAADTDGFQRGDNASNDVLKV